MKAYIPKKWQPHNSNAIDKWRRRLPITDERAAAKAVRRYNNLKKRKQ